MIELSEECLVQENRASSKGNQLKWQQNGVWYKADYTGYEGLTEYLVSHLFRFCPLSSENYVLYETEEIRYKKSIYRGCRSRDFLSGSWQCITLERLYRNHTGESLYKTIWSEPDVARRIVLLLSIVKDLTGLKDFAAYLYQALLLDAVFLNEDRHYHNIAVLMDGKGCFAYCPFFDFGASLLSDTTQDYPMGTDIHDLIPDVHAKTVSQSFDEQLDAMESIYDGGMKFGFRYGDVRDLLDREPYYPKEIKARILDIVMEQRRRYAAYFRDA